VLAACGLPLPWRRGSACMNGECVEVAFMTSSVMIRNSRNHAIVLHFPRSAWRNFTSAVGQLDRVAGKPVLPPLGHAGAETQSGGRGLP
jgi:hypothetical protein